MVLVRKVAAEDWETLRDIRLTALRDAPSAFGSTYAREATFTRQDWLRRIAGRSTFFAYLPAITAESAADLGPAASLGPAAGLGPGPDQEDQVPEGDRRPVGLVGGYQEKPGVAELVSMWVDPRARGRGVGEALIEAMVGWARTETDASTLHLWVTESNKSATRLYERCGFRPTGERQALPSDPTIPEIAMSLDLGLLTSTLLITSTYLLGSTLLITSTPFTQKHFTYSAPLGPKASPTRDFPSRLITRHSTHVTRTVQNSVRNVSFAQRFRVTSGL